MTTRKPPTPPRPRITRAPAKQKPEAPRPITDEIMNRVRRVINASNREIEPATIAQDLDANAQDVSEWVSTRRYNPNCERLAQFIRWLAQHDPTFIRDVILAKKMKTTEHVDMMPYSRSNITEHDVRYIRSHPDIPAADLAEKFKADRGTIIRIRNRETWQWVK